MLVERKNLLGVIAFATVIAVGTYLLFDLEALTKNEVVFIDRLERDIAHALRENKADFFPDAGRMPSKFQMGGSPPAIYKLKVTTGRRGRRLTFDLSIKRTSEKAGRKFETRWTHEIRAHRLGTLDVIELKHLDSSNSRLARIRTADDKTTGVFFLAHRERGVFSLTLKGIVLDEFEDFERMISPTLDTIARDGAALMLESP